MCICCFLLFADFYLQSKFCLHFLTEVQRCLVVDVGEWIVVCIASTEVQFSHIRLQFLHYHRRDGSPPVSLLLLLLIFLYSDRVWRIRIVMILSRYVFGK